MLAVFVYNIYKGYDVCILSQLLIKIYNINGVR